jgi:putative peptide zinc metalloprotease protein
VTTDSLDLAAPPRLAAGVELLGPLQNSGFTDPPSLIRRPDGQVIQLSGLMYRVASLLDGGTRSAGEIAARVTNELGRTLTAEQVRYLVSAKLTPLGIVADPNAPVTAPPTASPLLALRARATLLPPAVSSAAGTFLRPLFRPPIIAVVLVTVGVLDYWVLSINGLAAAFRQVLNTPVDLLLVAALAVASALFHECGHAAGCRYGGARPGRIGFGIYLVWPSFFTNVTDSYRLSRAGRLRTDLGGLYFNLIFILVLAGIYAGTSARVLLLVIAFTHLEMLEQLLPFVRCDGYFILSDLVGVPDLFARVVPVLRSTIGRRPDSRAASLRRPARIVITAWVLAVLPLLALTLGSILFYLPAAGRDLWQSADVAGHAAATDFGAHRYTAAAADVTGALLAAISVAGMVYLAFGLARRAFTVGRRWSAGNPRRRVLAFLAGLACVVPLTLFWLVQGEFLDW